MAWIELDGHDNMWTLIVITDGGTPNIVPTLEPTYVAKEKLLETDAFVL